MKTFFIKKKLLAYFISLVYFVLVAKFYFMYRIESINVVF
jgi:hypothetical protein